MAEDATEPRPGVFLRETLEFERVAFFSDAIFAIALTLLVVGLDVPKISDEFSSRELWDALDDMWPQLLMFFISFAVLGSFWLGHHRHFSRLAAIDRRATGVNLVYLALIAFLPFPSGVLGEYADNSVAVILYASCIAAIASLSALLTEIATRHGLFARPPTPEAVRWQRILPLAPAAYFLLTIPLALAAPATAVYSWILLFPLSMALQRRMPKDVAEYFEAC
jgi:TMEM175 potassium channel family protein